MFQKLILACLIAGAAQAGVLPAAQVVEEIDHYPQYNYGYSVQDPITGDFKGQEETRDGNVVRGRYSLMEPDGTFRVVTYMADETGFHAVVERQGHGYAVGPAPVDSRPQPVAVPVHRPITVAVQQPRPVHVQVQVPFRPVQPIQEVQVVQEQRPIHVVQQPYPVQEVQPVPVEGAQSQPPQVPVEVPAAPQPQPVFPQPHPQPVPQPQPQPQPIPQPHPQPVPQPQPQPQPIPQPQPQPIPQPIPQPQPQPIPQPQPEPISRPPRPQPPQPEESFDDAEVIEARRADSGFGQGSLSSYRSSRNGQHNFNFSF